MEFRANMTADSDIEYWPEGFVKKIKVKGANNWVYFSKDQELKRKDLNKVKVYEYAAWSGCISPLRWLILTCKGLQCSIALHFP